MMYYFADGLNFISKIYDLERDIWTIYCLPSEIDNLVGQNSIFILLWEIIKMKTFVNGHLRGDLVSKAFQ